MLTLILSQYPLLSNLNIRVINRKKVNRSSDHCLVWYEVQYNLFSNAELLMITYKTQDLSYGLLIHSYIPMS